MNCRDIIKAYLLDHGYDGLYCVDCGCELEQLMPCESCCDECKPGVKIKVRDEAELGANFTIIGPEPIKTLPTISEMSGSIPGIGVTDEED